MRYGLLILALLLFFVWLGAFVVFHVVGAVIHLLLLVALVLFIAHLFRRSRVA